LVPSSFSAFFAASAGVAGALIGLLFVAISVAPGVSGRQQRVELDIRAGVAFSALTDALVVALFALIPGLSLATPTMSVAATGFASCVALGIVLMRAEGITRRRPQVRLLAIQSLAFIYQFAVGLQLSGQPGQQSNIRTLAILTVVFFLVGIARAWELIGARDTGLFHAVRDAIHERSASAQGPPPD
jgi:hypothetical protein